MVDAKEKRQTVVTGPRRKEGQVVVVEKEQGPWWAADFLYPLHLGLLAADVSVDRALC